ncbi:MAG: translocation/assembly module TamB, partial [Prolixibacteraceae bacterium]|nr:translocation/assembly module TamB [Prolixibacteraceae bacterium]
SGEYNFSFLSKAFKSSPKKADSSWKFNCNRFELVNGNFNYFDNSITTELIDLLSINQLNVIIEKAYFRDINSLKFTIDELNLKSKNGFEILEFTSVVSYSDSILNLTNTEANTVNSKLIAKKLELSFQNYFNSKKIEDIKVKLNLNRLDFGLRDISFLFDPAYDNGITTKLKGEFQGDLNDLRGKNLNLSVGNFTNLNGNFYINGLLDFKTAYLFFDLQESFANLNEIRNLDLPPKMKMAINNLPSFLDNVGVFSYKGNFTGFHDDFVAYGTAYSNLGTIKSDISFKPHKHEELSISGHLSTNKLDIGSIFNNNKFDNLSLNGNLNGTVKYGSDYDLVFDGIVDEIDFNDYKFQKINLKGAITNKQFEGDFSILDPNLEMRFDGKLDLIPELPVFEFIAEIDHANLQKLNIVKNKFTLKLNIDANFEGDNIDNVKGQLALSDVFFENEIDSFSIQQIVLDNSPKGDTSVFTLTSDLVDGQLIGRYNFMNIGPSIISFYQRYLPSSYYSKSVSIADYNAFDYHFNIKNIMPIINVINPDLYINPDIEIKGYYHPSSDSMLLETFLPLMRNAKQEFENVSIQISADKDRIHARSQAERIALNSKVNIYNLTLDSEGKSDLLDLNLFWNNYGQTTYSGKIITQTKFERTSSDYPHITTNIEPSKIYFSDSLWTIDKTKITIDSSSVAFYDLNFHSNNQRFVIDGSIANNDKNTAFAKIENVDLLLFEPLMGRSLFTGRINGEAKLVDFFEKMMLDLNLSVNNLSFKDGYLGELNLKSNWDHQQEKLISTLSLTNDDVSVVDAKGSIDPLNGMLDMNAVFKNTPLTIMGVIMPSSFNNQHGFASGNIHIHGRTDQILLDGVIIPDSRSSIGLSYLNTTYYFRDPVYFASDSILFKQFKFEDKDNNRAVLDGSIKHSTFKEFVYDLHVDTPNLLALNTTAANNDSFYGTAYVSGTVDITGAGNSILLYGDARSEKGTNVYIPFNTEENAEQYDFIEFINNDSDTQKENEYNVVTTGLDMNFDLELTPEAKVQLIFNSQFGDVIKGAGNGNLQVKIDRNYKINMYGNYVIEEGDYLFSLQNILNKRFTIRKGGTIEWIGDPYDALIDIEAMYKVKTSLSDLFVNNYQDIDLSRRIPVDCRIILTDKLTSPKIDFAIELPTAEERIKEQVGQLIVTKEDVNKQIISLLMLGRFYTPEFFAGKPTTETGAELVGTTASELFSNQLSNWLSQITDMLDIGINYRPGNDISDDQIELALSTQILNDRITLDGNIANNANPNSNKNGDVIGDFDLNIKLTDNGKLQFKAYNHSNDNIIYDTSPYTQGLGFSYREEFNTFSELISRFKKAILRKSKKKKLKNE